MFTSTFFAVVFGAVSALAGPVQRKCGTQISDARRFAAEKHFVMNKVPSGLSPLGEQETGPATLKVYWHVVSKDDTVSGGNLTEKMINDSIDVLNEGYRSMNIGWELAGVTYTNNPTWFTRAAPDTAQQTDMKTTLRQGTMADLNVYSVGFESGSAAGLLGYATFPADSCTEDSPPKCDDFGDDGVVILHSSVPGGSTDKFNLGQTLTHEAGHWVGLYHTFQGGCKDGDAAGDFVSDTPAEASPASGCPVGRDTCKSDDKVDPIHNFMDYSDDDCLCEFTDGQRRRAQDQMRTYRGVDVPNPDSTALQIRSATCPRARAL
ncbi:hypothetical protein HGRIS_008526 [Hohenbuehelia grisea]|uniref:Peptidase M43 pregnancy-associated plasma-A domain-containing protein n=1 Tax=Hohenbuehelia grisea TaxID=104357 RepID=A0ABR3J9A5_9AGAR